MLNLLCSNNKIILAQEKDLELTNELTQSFPMNLLGNEKPDK